MNSRIFLTVVIILLAQMAAFSQEYTLSGYVKDASNNEDLFNASIFVEGQSDLGTTTNSYGFYSLTLPAGEYNISVAYLGYEEKTFQINLDSDTKKNIQLSQGVALSEVVVSSSEADKNVSSTDMGTVNLSTETIKELPAIFGEVDIMKTLQLLPGVLASGEGSSGFFVRGGGADQNLILLDEAVVYNSGHLLGFFSVFNADAIKNTTLIKGSMPARYGGRLSSVVDVKMKEGNSKEYAMEGGVGLISSRLTVEGPIVKNKSSFMISGRRTYLLDLAQPFLKGGNFEGTNYYFYDLNTKFNYKFSDKDRIYLSGYFGRDVFKFNSAGNDFGFNFPYGNTTLSMRWNHLHSDKLFLNLTAVYNDYNYEFSGGQDEFQASSRSRVRDIGLKARWEYFPSTSHDITFGIDAIHHALTPNIVRGESEETTFSNDLQTKYGASLAAYFMDEWKLSPRWNIMMGMRLSSFAQLGPYEGENDTYDNLEPVISYLYPEPRLSARYKLDENSSLKGGIGYTVQYLHLVSNSTSTLPIDIWVPSSQRIKPQQNIQYSLGYFRNFNSNTYEFSTEVYYRDLYNQIDYRDDYVNSITAEVEDEFVFGSGRAYGAEFYLKKKKGDLTGWISYTMSRSERSFPDIEDGRVFPATYDKTHDLSVVTSYEFSPKYKLSATFVYGSGKWYTPIEGFYNIENSLNVFYGPRNSERLEDYHRLDLSFTYSPAGGKEKDWKSSWNFSIYNVYNHKNPFFVYTTTDTDQATGSISNESYKVSIFPIIPSISWNFKWNQ